MAYAQYGSFADLLRQAKTQAQLRGSQIDPGMVKSMGQGFFSEALDSTNADRANTLAESSQSLAEQQSANQQSQFAESLAFSKRQAEAQQEAAAKAGTQGSVQTGISALGTGYSLLKGTGMGDAVVDGVGNIFAPTATEAAITTGGEAGQILGDMGENTVSNASITAETGANTALTGTEELATQGVGTGFDVAENGGLATADSAIVSGGPTGASTTLGAVAGTIGTAVSTALPYVAAARLGMPTLGRTLSKYTPGEPDSSNVFQQGATITKDEYMSPIEAAAEYVGAPIPEVAQVIFNPGGALMKASGTWICTEIARRHGIDKDDEKALSKLRRYSIKNHRKYAEKYLKEGHRLIEAMKTRANIDDKYGELKETLVKSVCDLVRDDNMEEAYGKYKEITLNLCEEYEVEP